MASLGAASQVSIDDILEYTSNNEELLPGEQTTQHQGYLPDFVPDTSLQLETDSPAPALAPFQGYQPNTDIYALNKHDLSHRAGKSFVPLAPPSSEMLQNAADPRIAELIPQDHPEWQNLRSGQSSSCSTLACMQLCLYALSGRTHFQGRQVDILRHIK